jgi:hypothetical protein
MIVVPLTPDSCAAEGPSYIIIAKTNSVVPNRCWQAPTLISLPFTSTTSPHVPVVFFKYLDHPSTQAENQHRQRGCAARICGRWTDSVVIP